MNTKETINRKHHEEMAVSFYQINLFLSIECGSGVFDEIYSFSGKWIDF